MRDVANTCSTETTLPVVSPPATNFQRQWVGLVAFSLSQATGSDLVRGQQPGLCELWEGIGGGEASVRGICGRGTGAEGDTQSVWTAVIPLKA